MHAFLIQWSSALDQQIDTAAISLMLTPLFFSRIVALIITSHENDSWKKQLNLPTKDERPQTEVSFLLKSFSAYKIRVMMNHKKGG